MTDNEIEQLKMDLEVTRYNLGERMKELASAEEKIVALIAGQETLQKHIAEQKAEIDYWKRNAFDGCMERSRIEKTAKAEAIKEFAERLKEETTERYEDIAYKDLFFGVIDNLVKEMVGDKHDQSEAASV